MCLRFFAINRGAFPLAPYKLPPSINNIFTHALFFLVSLFHFHRTLFRGLAGACDTQSILMYHYVVKV